MTIDALGYKTTELFDAAGNLTYVKDASQQRHDLRLRRAEPQDRADRPARQARDLRLQRGGPADLDTDRLGRRRDFTYDALDRQTAQIWTAADGTTVDDRLTFTYDADGNQLTAPEHDGAYTMTYDALNRVTVAQGRSVNTLTFSYDAVGNRTQVRGLQRRHRRPTTYDAA